MKKIIIFFCIFLYSIAFSFAESLASFNGISFGMSKENSNSIMIEKGWTFKKDYSNENKSTYYDGIYAGIKANVIELFFYKDKFQKATLSITIEESNEFETIISLLQSKYNLVVEKDEIDKFGFNVRKYVDKSNENWISIEKKFIKSWGKYSYSLKFYCNDIMNEENNDKQMKIKMQDSLHESDL